VATADSRRARGLGLARLDGIEPHEALLIPRCRSIHTFGMRFALDLVWLDGEGAVVRVDRDVTPRRFRTCLRARAVVECAAGRAAVTTNARAAPGKRYRPLPTCCSPGYALGGGGALRMARTPNAVASFGQSPP